MGLVIIFGLVTILAIFGLIRSLKEKNFLGMIFAFGALAVFGWFAVMTVLNNGFPTTH
ncbi:DUF2759 domain-containing protein [Metabacillus niabensis]|uniref:DUF2759 domain-containing protein n=1 Tax=Metabacillus niabensis TaxID=324854 RepID=A0ABT9YY72_9BACI|nr:DUF2759 domain-containing protein [Metabacillus niabensis]MDQ0224882.1 hypothetical protein [Metabacillus niabensis]PAD69410.1 DUF2759 domain-containing protein [Bacillus sp. 7586-K]